MILDQFTLPLSRYSCIYEKKIKTFCREKSWGWVGSRNNTPRTKREGVTAKINELPNFDFVSFPFCHNTEFVPEIRRR